MYTGFSKNTGEKRTGKHSTFSERNANSWWQQEHSTRRSNPSAPGNGYSRETEYKAANEPQSKKPSGSQNPKPKPSGFRGYDPSGSGDEPKASTSGGYRQREFMSSKDAGEPVNTEEPAPTEESATRDQPQTKKKSSSPQDKSSNSTRRNEYDPNGLGDERQAPNSEGYGDRDSVSPIDTREPTATDRPSSTDRPAPTEEPEIREEQAATEEPAIRDEQAPREEQQSWPWPFFGELESKTARPTHAANLGASVRQQSLTRPLFWTFEARPSTADEMSHSVPETSENG